MRRIGAAAAALWLVGACAAPAPQRAAWLVRDRLAAPSEVRRACRAAREQGLDRVLVQVRGRGDAWYRSRLAPRAEPLAGQPPGYDPLGLALESCDRVPLAAWLNVFYLWGAGDPPQDPAHPVRAHPEWILSDDRGRRVDTYSRLDRALGWIEGVYADPASQGYRDRFARIVEELVDAYPVSEVHLDFIRYPGPGYGQAGPLGRRFRETWGLDPRLLPPELRDRPDLVAWASGSMPAGDRVLTTLGLLWAEARAREVTALVRGVNRVLAARAPKRRIALSAAVWPDPGPAYRDKGQDWRTWIAEGLVDALYPMAYFGPIERFTAQVRRIVPLADPWGTELWIGLGAYIKDPDEIAREAAAARAAGVERFCLFDWGTLLDRPEGPGPWVRALAVGRGGGRSRPAAPTPGPGLSAPGARILWALVDRVTGGRIPPAARQGLERRWGELQVATQEIIPDVLQQLEKRSVTAPPWVDLDGIFRYVSPDDPPERLRAQEEAVRAALDRVRAGEPFEAVAREVSQGGSARFGGPLGRRHLFSGTPGRDLLERASAGEVVGPVRVENGFWLYRVRARGEGGRVPFAEAPWPVRRAAFRRALNDAFSGGAS